MSVKKNTGLSFESEQTWYNHHWNTGDEYRKRLKFRYTDVWMFWCLKPRKDTSIGPGMRVMERKRTVLEKLRWQEEESNKPFWKEQCRNHISALVFKTFPQAKRNNFWDCQCLMEKPNSSLSTLKSHHKLSFLTLSLLPIQRLVLHRNRNPKYSQVLQIHSHADISLLRTHLPTAAQARVAPLSPGQRAHLPYAFCRSVGQGCDSVYGPTACSWYTCSLALRAPISFHCTGHSKLSASHNAHYQSQDHSLLEGSSSLAARAHPSHLTDVQ